MQDSRPRPLPAAADLRQALRLLRATSLDAVIAMDESGRVAEWNDCAAEMFGWSSEEAVGQELAQLVIPERYRQPHREGFARFLATGEGPLLGRRIQIVAVRRSGVEFPIELAVQPIRTDQGWLFVGSLRDLSELRRAESLRQQEIAERQKGEESQKLLLAELNHRVKNMLAVVTGIAAQSARSSRSMAAFNENFLSRLASLGRAHTLLTERQWGPTPLKPLVEELLAPYAQPQEGQLQIAGPPVALLPKPALALSMILHELVTNATKYGALSVPEGRIFIEWSVSQPAEQVRLTWRETGFTALTRPRRAGFGTRMIKASAEHELGGAVEVRYLREGVCYDFRFPLNQ